MTAIERALFLGQSCAAAMPPLTALIDAGFGIPGVVLARQAGMRLGELQRVAAAAGIPVVWVKSAAEATETIRSLAPQVAVAACFPWRLPRAARETPPLGILNVHPSLLPVGRGPEPVFWILRRGEPVTGVTVHRMDAGFDTGPIVAQARMSVPEGIAAPDLERDLMALGGSLLVDALPELAAGRLQPRPQSSHGATYAPVPGPADWTMMSSLPAAWAWRFARGVAPLGGPLTAIAGGAAIRVVAALDWSPDEKLSAPVLDDDDGTVRVRFSPGWVRFRRNTPPKESLRCLAAPPDHAVNPAARHPKPRAQPRARGFRGSSRMALASGGTAMRTRTRTGLPW
jgi:methionyl-tRNA formyltransferase